MQRQARPYPDAGTRWTFAPESLHPSMIEAWFSASENTTSPGPTSAAMVPQIGGIPGGEQECGVPFEPGRERLLGVEMRGVVADHQRRCARARGHSQRWRGQRLRTEPEVVVRAKEPGRWRRLEDPRLSEQPQTLESGGLFVEEREAAGHLGLAHSASCWPACPSADSVTESASSDHERASDRRRRVRAQRPRRRARAAPRRRGRGRSLRAESAFRVSAVDRVG